jgi:hypothetical protein
LERLGTHFGRDLLLAHVASLAEATSAMSGVEGSFVLCRAVDSSAFTHDELKSFADEALAGGAAYLCAWGPGCVDVEVTFDLAYVDAESGYAALCRAGRLMTSSQRAHTKARAWRRRCTSLCGSRFPTAIFEATCKTTLTVVISNHEWAEVARSRLREPEHLPDFVDMS